MRTALLRSNLIAVAFSLTVVGLPTLIIAKVIVDAARDPAGSGSLLMRLPTLLAVAIVLLASAVLGVYLFASREANRLAAPLVQLAEQAERLGSGDARITRTSSGIAEIDRVSDVLGRSAATLLGSLASEREFAADASHQLRTPLTALLMRLEEIAYTDDLDVVREEAGLAIEQVERLTGTVDTLLSRARHTGDPIRPVRVDRVLAELQRAWQPAFEAAQRSIRVTGERGVQVYATDVALSQIFSTLVENGFHHGGGTVEIDVRHSGPSVVIEVADHGPGIEANLAPFVFERNVSTKSSGLGLGLARDLAERYGGRLELVRAAPVLFALFLSAYDPE